ncbi:MAG TPA: hypothetical protein VHN59_09135 [Chitinophagaceae bacterium]|nr:hypothetical protein [Chitinophagaceae bacterium]
MNSGSYLTALFTVVFGITILDGLGGSFFIIGFAVGLMDTSDCGSKAPDFFTTGGGVTSAGLAATGLGSGLAAATGFAGAGFFAGSTFLTAGLGAGFAALTAGLAGFALAGAGLAAFLAAGFFAAGLAAFAAFGAGLDAFFGTGFFLLAIH